MKKLGFILLMIALIPATSFAGKKGMKKDKSKKEVKSKAELHETHWRLSEIDGKIISAGEGGEAFLVFAKKGRIEGNTSCNTIGGTYKEGKFDALKIEAVSTKMACPDMKTESYMNNALSYTNRYMINGRHLLLYNDNLLLALFEAQDAQ